MSFHFCLWWYSHTVGMASFCPKVMIMDKDLGGVFEPQVELGKREVRFDHSLDGLVVIRVMVGPRHDIK